MARRMGRMLLLLILAWAAPVAAGPPFACCYCTRQSMDNRALLCEALPSDDASGFAETCIAKGGDTYPCIAVASPDACPAVFHAADLTCPEGTQAPVMNSAVLLLLAAALSSIGVAALGSHRRSRVTAAVASSGTGTR